MPATVYLSQDLTAPDGVPRGHFFVGGSGAAWPSVQIAEWELRGEEWIDTHPHDEYNFVLEGSVMVSCEGVTTEAPVGSLVHTPAGTTGRYWAPTYARMLGIYGPNPSGAESSYGRLRGLDEDEAAHEQT